jgi:AraC family transcriptional regulator
MTHKLGFTASLTIPGFVISEFVQPPRRRLPWHEHRHASVCYVVSGTYAEVARGREQECAPRSMVFKPAAERHADVFGNAGGRCLLIEILPDRLATLEPCSEVVTKPGLTRSARLAALGQRLYEEFRTSDDVSSLALEGGILEVLAEAARGARDDSRTPPSWLRRARDLLHDRAGESLTLSSVAREVGAHPSHLARAFRRHYRRTVGEYVRGLRIERACRELADGHIGISQIGLQVGFYDQSHFTRVFKRHTGMTPGEFRALSS